MDKKNGALRIQKIKNGTVIDHLPAGTALTVLRILGISRDYKNPVSVVMNVASKSLGMKDVVKVEDRILRAEETDKLSLIAPEATINIIRDYRVSSKSRVTIPNEFTGVLKCGNPSCITNMREPVTPVFTIEKKKPIVLRCEFCERIMEREMVEEQL